MLKDYLDQAAAAANIVWPNSDKLKWINGFIRNDNKYRYFTNLIKNNWLKK